MVRTPAEAGPPTTPETDQQIERELQALLCESDACLSAYIPASARGRSAAERRCEGADPPIGMEAGAAGGPVGGR